MSSELRVMVWNENVHEKKNPDVAKIYPKGMHGAIAKALKSGHSAEDTAAVCAVLEKMAGVKRTKGRAKTV